MPQPEAVRIPLFPFARLWFTVVSRARRRAAPVIAVVAALVMIAGIGVAAVSASAKGCSWRVVAGPGRVHWACEVTR